MRTLLWIPEPLGIICPQNSKTSTKRFKKISSWIHLSKILKWKRRRLKCSHLARITNTIPQMDISRWVLQISSINFGLKLKKAMGMLHTQVKSKWQGSLLKAWNQPLTQKVMLCNTDVFTTGQNWSMQSVLLVELSLSHQINTSQESSKELITVLSDFHLQHNQANHNL